MEGRIYAKSHGDFCTIAVEVSPGAARTEITGIDPWRKALQIRVAAQAKDGKANAELIRFIAEKTSVPAGSVRLLKGEKSSLKVIRLPLSSDRACELLRGD